MLTRFTKDAGFDEYPVWSPDGKRIAFASSRSGSLNLFWQATDGTGAAERLTTSEGAQFPWFFTLDGKALVIRDTDPKTFMDISLVSVEGNRTSKPLIRTPFSEQNAQLSPDGRYVAYESNESGTVEVYVRPFPDVDAGHWQASTGGGTRPLWARSGRELFYVEAGGSRIMTVSVEREPSFALGNPTSRPNPAAGSTRRAPAATMTSPSTASASWSSETRLKPRSCPRN